MGPTPIWGVSLQEEENAMWRQTECHMTTDTKTGLTELQAKGCQGLTATIKS